MAVYSTVAKAGPYTADGSQTRFPYGFRALDPSHVKVVVDREQITSGITVTIGSEGGDVVFDVPPVQGSSVSILRNVPFTQLVDFQNNTAFYPEIIEDALDKLTMGLQQLSEVTSEVIENAPGTGGGSGGGSTVADSSIYQFAVIDASAYSTTGAILSKAVSVVNGRSTNATSCGTLNGVAYPRTDLSLSDGVDTYYIYASGGDVYALRHRLHSDLIPTLLLATVRFASDGKPVITQESFVDNPFVYVRDAECGASLITARASYSGHVLHYTYSISAQALCNNSKLTYAGELTATGSGEKGFIVAYVDTLNVPNGVSASAGIKRVANVGNAPVLSAEWYQNLLVYTLTGTNSDQDFRIISRSENPYLFTFTTLPLNASEVEA